MDRLETAQQGEGLTITTAFTFQYGQIRNNIQQNVQTVQKNIYIPVWIDQKPAVNIFLISLFCDLHSSMDRLETCLIYHNRFFLFDLHSSMDRLETGNSTSIVCNSSAFTFQYGQIRNLLAIPELMLPGEIYIPVWIDQKLNLQQPIDLQRRIYIPVWIDQKLVYIIFTCTHYFYLHSSMDRLETYWQLCLWRTSW